MKPRRKLELLDWTTEVVQRHAMHAQRIVEVFPTSPAEALGIRTGWLAVLAGDVAPTSLVLNDLRLNGANGFVFYDPEKQQTWHLEGGSWPFGLLMTPVDTEGFRARIAVDSSVSDDLLEAFGRGEVDTFARLIPAFREAMQPTSSALFGPLMSQARQDKAIAKSGSIYFLAFLSFAYLSSDDIDRATYFRNACLDAIDSSKITSFSLRFTALLDHIGGKLAYTEGDTEQAIAFAERAMMDAPQYAILRDTFATWTDSPPLIHRPRWVGDEVPIRYHLPQHDPFGFWPEGPEVALDDALAKMDEDQLMVLILLPNYRANYYYNVDIGTLAALYRYDPQRIAAVHVIASGDTPVMEDQRIQVETSARDNGVPLQFLWNEGNDVTDPLDLYRSPTTLVLNAEGTVLANGLLSDESAYWQAIERNNLRG